MASPTRFGILGRNLAVAASLFAVILWSQWRLNAYAAEFLVDEPYHLVSGMVVHDYLVQAFGKNPLAYLRDYHGHYPLVGIGHWGPAFYGIEALWMLAMPATKGSVLLFSALIAAGLAFTIFLFSLPRLGLFAALFAAFGYVLCAITQEAESELLLDVPVAASCFAAMIVYERYIATEQARWNIAFALIAAFAVLIKGNGFALCFLPPLRLLLGWRFAIMRRLSFWLPVPIVLVLAGPWYAMTHGMVSAGFRFETGVSYAWTSLTANGTTLVRDFGWPALAIALASLSIWRRADLRGPLALLLAVILFQLLAPAAIQPRYLSPMLPPLLILIAAGGSALCDAAGRILPDGVARTLPPVLFAGLLATITLRGEAVVVKPLLHLDAAAEQIRAALPAGNPVVLVATDLSVENGVIAELAIRDPRRPSMFAVRASKLLGGGGFNTDDYTPRWQTPEQVMRALDDYAIPLVLFRRHIKDQRRGLAQRDLQHLEQIEAAQRMFPDRWELIYRDEDTEPEILLFRLRGNDSRTLDAGKLLAVTAPKGLE
jgi:hypothetical protein